MPYICDRCCLLCSDLSMLRVHMRKHTNEKPFSCHVCGRRFAQKGNLNAHLSNVHNNVKQFICDVCSKQFAQRKALEKHQQKCGRLSREELSLNMNHLNHGACNLSSEALSKLSPPADAVSTSAIDTLGTPVAINQQMFGCNEEVHLVSGDSDHRKNDDDQIFICDKCNETFKSKTKLILHIAVHDGMAPKPFTCHICDKGFTHKGSMNAHIRFIHKGEKPFTCLTCYKKFSNKCHLKLHERTHSRERPHACESCGKTFARIEHYRYHLKTHAEKDEIFGCIFCKASFNSAAALKKHVKLHTENKDSPANIGGGDVPEVQCNNSPKMLVPQESPLGTPSAFNISQSKCESIISWSIQTTEKLPKKPAQKHDEIISKYVSNNTDILEKFTSISHEQVSSTSFLSFSASSTLDARTSGIGSASMSTIFNSHFTGKPVNQWSHQNLCLNESPVTTSVLPVTNLVASNFPSVPPIIAGKQLPGLTPIASALKISSLLTVDGVTPSTQMFRLFRCTECDKTFSSSHHLLSHMRVHSGERPYKCEVCSSCFTQASSLKFHINTVHTGERKHKCSVCSWTFARMSHLKRHALRHSQEKPYKCLKCSRTFIEKSKLRLHLSSHTPDDEVSTSDPVLNPPTLPTNTSNMLNGSDEAYSLSNVLVSCEVISASGDCSNNHGRRIEISQCPLRQNQIFSTTSICNDKTGYEESIPLMQPFPGSNKVDDLNLELKEHCGERLNHLNNSNVVVNNSSVSNIMTRSRAKLSESITMDNNPKKNVVDMTQDIRTSLQNGCDIMAGGKRSSISTRQKVNRQDKAVKTRRTSRKNAESFLDIENDEKRNERDAKVKNDSCIVRPPVDVAMQQDEKTKRIEAINNRKKEARAKCEQCGKSFKSLANLRTHSVVHSGLKPYVCTICNKSFTQNSSLRVHVAVIHNHSRKHQCPQCPKTFSQRSHLNRHLSIHTGSKPFSCENCDRRFCEIRKLMLHKKVHERRERMDKERKEQPLDILQLTCKICSKMFMRRSYLKKHMALHEHSNTYQCDRCSKQYRHKSSLEMHMRWHTGEKPFSCDFCNKRFSRHSCLTIHKVTQHEVRAHKCSACPQTFNKVSSLASHLRKVHGGVLSEQGDLQTDQSPKHLIREPRPWSCGNCSKRFSHKSALDIHNRVHSREKPFACPFCSKSFTQKGSLISHLRSIHSDGHPFCCHFCDHKFNRKKQLLDHCVKDHSGNSQPKCSQTPGINIHHGDVCEISSHLSQTSIESSNSTIPSTNFTM